MMPFGQQVVLERTCEMTWVKRMPFTCQLRRPFAVLIAAAVVLLPRMMAAQILTGTLVGTVKDEQGAVLPGALVRLTSSALIGGPLTVTTNDGGQLRFPVLSPGSY